MKALLFSIIFIYPAFSDDCAYLFSKLVQRRGQVYTVDFPIEKYYPNVRIVNGHIPSTSRAYLLWRSRSSGWLKDDVFAAHYLSKIELARKAGFMIADSVEHLGTDGLHLTRKISDAAKHFLDDHFKADGVISFMPINHMGVNPRKVAEDVYGSISKMFTHFGDTFHATKEKISIFKKEKLSDIRWMVTDDGVIYMWTSRQAERLKSETNEVLNGTHFDILSIITDNPVAGKNAKEEAPIIAMGSLDYSTPAPSSMTYIPGPGKFDFLQYLDKYLGYVSEDLSGNQIMISFPPSLID